MKHSPPGIPLVEAGPAHLKKIEDFLDDNCLTVVRVAQLADINPATLGGFLARLRTRRRTTIHEKNWRKLDRLIAGWRIDEKELCKGRQVYPFPEVAYHAAQIEAAKTSPPILISWYRCKDCHKFHLRRKVQP